MQSLRPILQTSRPLLRPRYLRSHAIGRQIPLRPFAPPLRCQSSTSSTSPSTPTASPTRKPWRPAPHRDPETPVYELYFTCKVCSHRSAHTISKQGYHHGTTLVKCPGCANRHLISDHLKIFKDQPTTVEDILRERGEDIRKGEAGGEGDWEFWEDEATKGGEVGRIGADGMAVGGKRE